MNETAASQPQQPVPEAAQASRKPLDDAAASALEHLRPGATVVIDGRSGSGKTEFARGLVAHWTADYPVVLVSMDDVYPGWDGLKAASESIVASLLQPRSAGANGSWQRYDWHTGEFAEQYEVGINVALIVEGCGSLTRASRELADYALWLDAPADVRRTRALSRDGAMFEPQWDAWAAQEEMLYAAEGSRGLADAIVETGVSAVS